MKFKEIYIVYLNLHKKQAFDLKKILRKCLFKVPLWHKIDNITSYYLISFQNLEATYLSFHLCKDS